MQLQVLRNDTLLDYTLLINQTAIHSLPAIINGVNSALLRAAMGGRGSITLTRHPLPVLPNERAQQVSQETGMLLLQSAECSAVLAGSTTVEHRHSLVHYCDQQGFAGAPDSPCWS